MQPAEKSVQVFIPNERLGEFQRKVEQLQKMAQRLELSPWSVSIGEKEWRPVDSFRKFGPGEVDHSVAHLEGSLVEITGAAPVISGWQFVAKIEHDAGGNLVKRMTGGDESPLDWHSCPPGCDHCKLQRNRNDTYMLSNVETGKIMQVGSSCMADFLGEAQRDPERIAAMYEFLSSIEGGFEIDPDKEVSDRSMGFGVPPAELMRAVLKIVQEDGGYISAAKGERLGCMTTGERLRGAFWGSKADAVVPGASDAAQAQQVMDWLREQKACDSLWLRNIAQLADRSCITHKNAGLFASGYVAWNRELQQQLRKDTRSGEWIAQVGDKIAVAATLERKGGYENAYGYVSVLSFCDEEGNALVWKTAAPPTGLVVGETYHLSATVKGQGDYKGDKQTEVIRVKCAELELLALGSVPGFKKTAAIAQPDRMDDSGHTPLLKAVWKDSAEHVKILLDNGADPNWRNQGEVPVLGYANSVSVAKLLLDAGGRAADLSDVEVSSLIGGVRELVLSSLTPVEIGATMPANRSDDFLRVSIDTLTGTALDWAVVASLTKKEANPSALWLLDHCIDNGFSPSANKHQADEISLRAGITAASPAEAMRQFVAVELGGSIDIPVERCCPGPFVDGFKSASYVGLITALENGVITQKVNRDGTVAYHRADALASLPTKGSVSELKYDGTGVAVVVGSPGISVER